jgi:putative transposase
MKRGPYSKVAERNEPLLGRIRAIKAEHPFWGYRRVWAYLKYVEQEDVNQKRVYRLMQAHALVVQPNTRLKAKRTQQRPKPRAVRPNEWWGVDMTKVMIDGFGWLYIVVVLDWYTKKVVGHYCGPQAKAWHWLAALNKAVNRQFPQGVRGCGLRLMSDNGTQPTAISFMKACRDMGINQAFTSYNNPKGNADTERFMRTLKEELVWINEWDSPSRFSEALDRWIDYYNRNYLHSSLGYQPPETFEQDELSRGTLLEGVC